MAYYETDLPVVAQGNNGNGMFGNSDGFWGIILLALLFGWGGNGFGRGVGGYGSSPATQADLATGFAQNTLQRGIDDIILGQASMQNFINQGFNGINTALMSGFHGVDNAICTLGYQTQTGFNGLSSQLASCCCDIRGAIADVKYATEKQTQTILDYMQNEKINALTAENVALKGRISNDAQSAYIIDRLAPKCAVPAYVVPNPNCCYNSCGGVAIQ